MGSRRRWILYGLCWLVLAGGLSPASAYGRAVEQAYTLGIKAYQDELWDLADQQFAEYLSKYPKGVMAAEAHFLRAEAQLQKKRYENAAGIYRDFARLYPDNKLLDRVYYRLGLCRHKLKSYTAAERAYQKALDKFPHSSFRQEVQLGLAESQYAQGKFNLAQKNYRQIIKRFPAHPNRKQALYGSGLSSLNLGDYKQATVSLKKLMADYPGDPMSDAAKLPLAQAYYKQGGMLYKQERYQQAIGSYRQLLKSYADNMLAPSATYNMGLCYIALGQPGKAGAEFMQLVAGYPKHELAAMAWLKTGELSFEREDYAAAGKAYLKAAGSQDKKVAAEAGYWLGECQAKQGKLDKALAEFLKLHLQYADQMQWVNPARFQAAQIYLQQGKKQAAEKLLLMVIRESTDVQLAQLAKDKLGSCK